ncbi:MAG TPA: nuclear transport factor 2 family protein [Solirubrobacteraceae bacterium]|jgi:ketosteroid isomerase-like protein
MSQENVELVRQMNARFNHGEVDAALDLMHRDVHFRDLQNAPDVPQAVRGRESVRLVAAQWAGAYDHFRADVLEYIDADPWVIVDVRWHGTGRGSGVSVELRGFDACRVESGEVVEWVVGSPDLSTALKAVGLVK